jgi:hypothetical protein
VISRCRRIGASSVRTESGGVTAPPLMNYPAKLNALIPVPNVKLDPTAPTTAVFRVRPRIARTRYTASSPVQCAPNRYRSPNSFSLFPVHSNVASVAANR